MRTAAARASSSTALPTSAASASAANAATSAAFRTEYAHASAVPHTCCGFSAPGVRTFVRFILMSRATSGKDSRSLSMCSIGGSLGASPGLLELLGQGLLAALPVARAQLVRLERVEDAENLVRVSTYR